jgi:hypothetical protein
MRDQELETTRRVMSHLGRIARENKLSLSATFPDEKTFVLTAVPIEVGSSNEIVGDKVVKLFPPGTKQVELFRIQDGTAMVQLTKLEEELLTLCRKHGLKYVE